MIIMTIIITIEDQLRIVIIIMISILIKTCVGRGGSLVESMPVYRRVVGSNPALAAM